MNAPKSQGYPGFFAYTGKILYKYVFFILIPAAVPVSTNLAQSSQPNPFDQGLATLASTPTEIPNSKIRKISLIVLPKNLLMLRTIKSDNDLGQKTWFTDYKEDLDSSLYVKLLKTHPLID